MLNILDNNLNHNHDDEHDGTVNPVERFLRTDRMPHIWCPGCGIGTTVNSFAHALIDSKIDLDRWPWFPASAAPGASPVM